MLWTGSNAWLTRKLHPKSRMVGHEYTTSTTATPITIAMTTKTRSSVRPRNSKSLGFLPNRVVTQSRLCFTTPRSDTGIHCCMHPPFHSALHCLPGKAANCSSRNCSRSCSYSRARTEMAHAPGRLLLAIYTRIARRTATHYGFDLCLILGDKGLWGRYIIGRCGELLTIVGDPPGHVCDGLPFVSIRLVLVDNHPGEAGNGIGAIAGRIDKVEAQVRRSIADILRSRLRAIDRWQDVLAIRIFHGSVLDVVGEHIR